MSCYVLQSARSRPLPPQSFDKARFRGKRAPFAFIEELVSNVNIGRIIATPSLTPAPLPLLRLHLIEELASNVSVAFVLTAPPLPPTFYTPLRLAARAGGTSRRRPRECCCRCRCRQAQSCDGGGGATRAAPGRRAAVAAGGNACPGGDAVAGRVGRRL